MAKPMATEKVKKMLRKAGFVVDRTCASHTIYYNGPVCISVPTGHDTISPGVMRKITNAIAKAA